MKFVWAIGLLLAAVQAADNKNSKSQAEGLTPVELGIIIGVSAVVVGLLALWVTITLIRQCRRNRRIEARMKATNLQAEKKPFPIRQDFSTKLRIDPAEPAQECIICLDLVAVKEIKLNPCGHTEFHELCLKQWVLAGRNSRNKTRCCRCTLPISSYSKYHRRRSKQSPESVTTLACNHAPPETVVSA